MDITRDGNAQLNVVCSPEAGEVEAFAASELSRYLGQITSMAIEVVASPTNLIPAYVGVRSKLGFDDLPVAADGHDGYVIQVRDDRIVIAGDNERGTLYGVYDLLERFGCRWFYPQIDPADTEVVPEIPNLSIRPFETAEAASFELRVAHLGSMIFALNVPNAIAHADWSAKARYNIAAFLYNAPAIGMPAQAMELMDELPTDVGGGDAEFKAAMWEYETSGVKAEMRKRGLLLEGPLHCFYHFMPNDLFEEHPDWFGMGPSGKREPMRPLGYEFCWSNPEAIQKFVDNVVGWLTEFPHLDIFAFTPNDGGQPCECPSCKLRLPSDWYAELANAIKRGLRAAGLQQPVEITGAYGAWGMPPSRGVLEDDIRVHWAHWGRRHDDWYGAKNYKMRDNLEEWLDRPNPFTMVAYHCSGFSSPTFHQPAARNMQRDTDFLRTRGVEGQLQLMNSGWEQTWWNLNLVAWMSGMNWYYADRDMTVMLDDYCNHYFGAAAGPMVVYHQLLDAEQWLTYYCGSKRFTASRPQENIRAADLLDRLEALIVEAESVASNEIEKLRVGKVAAIGRGLITVGRARIKHQDAVAAVEAWRNGGSADGLRAMLQNAIDHENNVVDPVIIALKERDGLGSQDMINKYAKKSAEIEKVLSELEADVSA